jgi:hypothetical protein
MTSLAQKLFFIYRSQETKCNHDLKREQNKPGEEMRKILNDSLSRRRRKKTSEKQKQFIVLETAS